MTLGASRKSGSRARGKEERMIGLLALSGGAATLLWIIAVILVIAGIVALVRGSIVGGIALIIIGLLIGPGGVSIFKCPEEPHDALGPATRARALRATG